jgi:hypothetical protein
VQETADGTIFVGGSTRNTYMGLIGPIGDSNIWVVKLMQNENSDS